MATGTIYCDWFRHCFNKRLSFENVKMMKLELGNTLTILQGVLHQYVRHLDTSYDNETVAQL